MKMLVHTHDISQFVGGGGGDIVCKKIKGGKNVLVSTENTALSILP